MRKKIIYSMIGLLMLTGVSAQESAALSRDLAAVFQKQLEAARQAPQPSRGVPVNAENLNRALILIGDSGSRGSGFLVNLWGMPVIITNAHVFALMVNPEVTNASREQFEIEAALVSKTRDLAILAVKSLPEGQPLLEISSGVASLPPDSVANAYGDSLGERVIVRAEGKLLGVGPDEIEINAEIVPGNSGGPVLNDNYEVIGVSTYLRKLSASVDILAGTRFYRGDGISGLIRRFALRIDNLNPRDFELFDQKLQQKDLAFYGKHEKIRQLCMNEIRSPHYNWSLYWPWSRPYPVSDYSNISNYLYCYSQFYRTDFKAYREYRASLSFIQRMLEQQQRIMARVSSAVRANPVQLSSGEVAEAERLFKLLQRSRKTAFFCQQCGGKGRVVVPGVRQSPGQRLSPPPMMMCPDCDSVGKYHVPYYGPWRTSPFHNFPRSSQNISGFRLGMELAEANKIADEEWRRDTSEYNVISVNGLFDCVRVERNPQYSNRAKRTELKFLARRLLSVAVLFENDQHNFPELKESLIRQFGKPDYELVTPGDWGYLLFDQEDITVTLSFYPVYVYDAGGRLIRIYREVAIRAWHKVLQHVEYLALNTFEQKLFAPPLKDYGGYIDFLP